MACRPSLIATTAILVSLSLPASAQQADPSASAAAASATASAGPAAAAVPSIPLPEIPPLTPVPSGNPSREASEELSTRLAQLIGTESVKSPLDDSVDWAFLTRDVDEQLILAAAQRLDQLKQDIDGDAAVRLLKKARNAGKKALRQRARETKQKVTDEDGDWLTFVLALGERDNQSWRDVAELYGMLRLLEASGQPHAVRVMVESYSSFGELVRIDLQRSIVRLKDIAVPALLEAKKHDASKVRSWAHRQLDSIGKAIPGEAVSTTDPIVLAAVLRAFGRIRDNDATRIILSFANSDRSELRQAAREAIGAMGEPASWHLKDTYKTLTDEKPPRDWDHVRTARELFRLYDRARLAEVYQALAKGQQAAHDKRYADAIEAYDVVLARAPLIEQRHDMAAAYEQRAYELLDKGDSEPALAMARKALRLAAPKADTASLRARLYYLEGKQLVDAGTPDPFILERAIELDPQFAAPKELLASLTQKTEERVQVNKRYVAAGVVGALGLAGLLVIARRRPREEEVAATAEPQPRAGAVLPTPPAPHEETPTLPLPRAEPHQDDPDAP